MDTDTIIKGSGRGIGRAAALMFADEVAGYNVQSNCVAYGMIDTR